MKYIDCIPFNSLDVRKIADKKPVRCNATIRMFLLNEPQKLLDYLEREDHFNGVGIIDLELAYDYMPSEFLRLIYSETRGMDLDPEKELDELIIYGKEYLLEDLQKELGCPVEVKEPENHFVALVSNGDQWFVSI